MQPVDLKDRSKLFTRIINKVPVAVVIYTATGIIHGNIHVRAGERILDEINEIGHFIPVTDALAQDHAGKDICRSAFIMINRDNISMIVPVQEISEEH